MSPMKSSFISGMPAVSPSGTVHQSIYLTDQEAIHVHHDDTKTNVSLKVIRILLSSVKLCQLLHYLAQFILIKSFVSEPVIT